MHEHRIYKHIGAPFRVFGLTLDELGCGLAGFGGAMYSMGSLSLQISFLTVGAGGIWGLKKLKSQCAGFQLRSYLYWHVMSFGVSSQYPSRKWRLLLP